MSARVPTASDAPPSCGQVAEAAKIEPPEVMTGRSLWPVLKSDRDGLVDEDGDYSDWIEIHNPTTQAIDLAGWHLTDEADNLELRYLNRPAGLSGHAFPRPRCPRPGPRPGPVPRPRAPSGQSCA